MTKLVQQPYTVGYDLGNRTVASVAINKDYNVVRQHGHPMALVNVFSEGKSKQERRGYRSARRNVSHKKWLKKQLYRHFQDHQIDGNIDEIQRRFKTSWISLRDNKRIDRKSDCELYLLQKQLYPTVWHAVDALIENDGSRLPKDLRGRLSLIYEVFHNLLGRRGHFLMPNLKVDGFVKQAFDFEALLDRLRGVSQTDLGLELGDDLDKFKQAMTMPGGITNRKTVLLSAIDNQNLSKTDRIRIKHLATLCVGGTVSGAQLKVLFDLTANASSKLQLGSSDVDDQLDVLSRDLDFHDLAVITVANQIYYQSQLSFLQKPGKGFVEVQLDNYKQFGKDLVLLKKTILPSLKSANDQVKYKNLLDRYLNSEDSVRIKNRKSILKTGKLDNNTKPVTQKDFINDCLKKLINADYVKDHQDAKLSDLVDTGVISRMSNGDFLVKTRSVQNSRIPEQAIQAVIRQIIDVQKNVDGLEWLGEQKHSNLWFSDEKYDLERFFDFRIPYYVGPLVHNTDQSEFSWLIRREPGTLTVFNFTQKVDLINSAQSFIAKLQAKDNYLLDELVMPASTMTYQKFAVLDELNRLSIKINGHFQKLTTDQKQSLYDLFKTNKTVSLIMAFRKLQVEFNILPKVNASSDAWLYLKGLSKESSKLDGNRAKFNNSLATYHKWKDTYGFTDQEIDDHFDDLEEIAEILTVFDQDSKLIKQAVLKKFKWLTESQINQLSRDHLDGWGRLSKKLLTKICDDNNVNVIDNMWSTQQTFNQVISQPSIKKQIDDHRAKLLSSKSTRNQAIDALLDRSYAAPAVRKVVHRFASSLKGVMKQMKGAPGLIVIESGREDGVGQTKITPIADQIDKVISKMDQSVQTKWKSLSDNEKKHLKTAQRLYFLQNGRDIYTGAILDYENLINTANIDHVVPQSLYKDDSLDNKVLTDKVNNQIKDAKLCATQIVTPRGRQLWRDLYKQGLMSKAKFDNLNTNWTAPVNVKQATHMLRRSLVETHQINRLCAQVATMMTKEYGTKVLTMQSAVTGYLRSKTQFNNTKNRSANDFHHGVDAYLIAFAGQYLWNKYEWLHPVLDYNDYQKINKSQVVVHRVGFGELFKRNGKPDDLIVNKSTGEILGTRGHLLSRLNKFDMNKLLKVRFEIGKSAIAAGGKLADATIYPAKDLKLKQTYLSVQGDDPAIYGYRQTVTKEKMVLVQSIKGKNKGQYRFVSVPRNYNNRIQEYVDLQVKNCKIIRDDLTVFDMFEIPGTGLKFAANGDEFGLRTEMKYSTKLLREINQKDQLSVDELKFVIKQIISQVKNQYQYMIDYGFGANFVKIGNMDVDKELDKESDVNHLREIIDDLLVGFDCSAKRVSFSIGSVKFSRLGTWRQTWWPDCIKMLK